MTNRAKYLVAGTLVVLAGSGFMLWRSWQVEEVPPGFAAGNGRIEATEVDVATKAPGRVEAVLVKEGDMVEAGQVLAQMDVAVLRAVLHEAEAGSAGPRKIATSPLQSPGSARPSTRWRRKTSSVRCSLRKRTRSRSRKSIPA